MSVIDSLLSDIDNAVRGPGERRRHALLRRTTATMIDQIGELSDHHLGIFDDVMFSLAQEVETETRAELAEKLADLTRAPRKTLRALALDDAMRVAKPLIERSPCLDDDTLIAIIDKGDPSCVSLVTRRRTLPPPILDYLIARADDALLVEIAARDAASISDATLRLLAERALTYQPLYKVLRTRPDLATRHIGAVIEAARYRAKSDAITRDLNDDMLSHALALETARSMSQSAHLSLSNGAASESHLTHDDMNDLLAREKIDDALLVLAQDAGVSPDSVKRAFHAPQHEPLMFLLRAQDYPVTTALHFMRLKHGALSDAFETQLSDAYCALARDTAKRIASFMAEKHPSDADGFDLADPLRHSA